ncbi:3183_t:CDS:2, partial [Gigaspora rosea]
MIFLEDESDESDDSRFEWYSYMWNNKVLEYKFGKNDSNFDDNIDEARRKDNNSGTKEEKVEIKD